MSEKKLLGLKEGKRLREKKSQGTEGVLGKYKLAQKVGKKIKIERKVMVNGQGNAMSDFAGKFELYP